ncbi:GNAT family N-acetyltransferase [Corynebacterium sp. H130]|uniref:GNAT family N-acetyltransferase n=1 Tax=Corynebacterium sp. H130 TaxID=3133444 RepID=UPI0030A95A1E
MAEAFWDDDAFRRYFKGFGALDRATSEAERVSALAPIFHKQLEVDYCPEGVVDVIESDGEIVGAACWSRPWEGAWFDFRSYIDQYGAHCFRMARRDAYSLKFHPADPHWYLYTLAVSPKAQGQGIGSKLLQHGLSRADETGHATYLEATTQGSQRLYERFGFVVKSEIPTRDPWVNEVGMVRACS